VVCWLASCLDSPTHLSTVAYIGDWLCDAIRAASSDVVGGYALTAPPAAAGSRARVLECRCADGASMPRFRFVDMSTGGPLPRPRRCHALA